MTKFVDLLRLAERAKEDVYFARLDRKLIAALHRRAGAAGADQTDRAPLPQPDSSGNSRTDKNRSS
ncbi:MAG TPA: hypothetical protein ENK05_07420 [Gammaproteobacteria bacterium]|nr:hypothetical protein [Gammaproteobacteria bacterium]